MNVRFVLVLSTCLGSSLSYQFVPQQESTQYQEHELEDYPLYGYRNRSKYVRTHGYDVEQRDKHKDFKDQYTSASASEYSDSGPWSGYGGGSYGGGGGFLGGGKPGGIGSFGGGGGKGRQGAKALLAVVIPLALLAAMGPLLASQVMLPLAVASTGMPLGNLATGRRKRSLRFLRRTTDRRAEFYRRLDMLGAIQRYLTEVGEETVFKEDLMASYLRCSGLLEMRNHCLERLACEYSDAKREMPSMEKEVVAVVFYNIMKNKHITDKEKKRYRKAARYGKFRKGDCSVYYCSKIDSETS